MLETLIAERPSNFDNYLKIIDSIDDYQLNNDIQEVHDNETEINQLFEKIKIETQSVIFEGEDATGSDCNIDSGPEHQWRSKVCNLRAAKSCTRPYGSLWAKGHVRWMLIYFFFVVVDFSLVFCDLMW